MLAQTPFVSKKILRDLRQAIAENSDPRQRLQKLVKIIADGLVAEVCSIYVRRAGDSLELFATAGLSPDAVNRTYLRVGEGLVGLVAASAAPLAESDAWRHPNFAYRPETGEEKFKSFLGVPILLGGRVVGVLCVQNSSMRQYSDDDVETLETISILLAYVITSSELVSSEENSNNEGTGLLPRKLKGVKINAGLGIGKAYIHDAAPRITRMLSDNPQEEIAKLHAAIEKLQADLHSAVAISASLAEKSAEPAEVMEAYQLAAKDKSWITKIRDAIVTGLSAEAAVQKVYNETRAKLKTAQDEYLRSRLIDLEEISVKLMRHIIGEENLLSPHIMDSDFIVVARDLGPATLLEFDRKHLKGVVLEEGNQTSHAAIVARALDIPLVGRVNNIMRQMELGDSMIVDGDQGEIYVRPGEDVVQSFALAQEARQKRKQQFAAARHLPSITADGLPVSLFINAGLKIDLEQMDMVNADGVGLFRTEISFMNQTSLPGIAEQTEFYREIMDQAGYRPVVFRTIDVGGDKALPHLPQRIEENPALGWRGLRLALDMPSLLRQQIRALLRAASGRRLSLMFPMVAEVAEFISARSLVDMELERLKTNGETLPQSIAVGAMVEVPALLWQMESLLQHVDFLSVGSNDLLQFLFASDRVGSKTSQRYDALSAPVLQVIKHLIDQCKAKAVPLTLCGEMASDPLAAVALVGLGMQRLSMAAPSIGPVKSVIRQLQIQSLQPYLFSLMDSPDHSLRPKIASFVKDRNILLPY